MSKHEIGGINLRSDKPTDLTTSDLHAWVIWQFPKRKGVGLCGAVHPPAAGHGWLPALIRQGGKSILVYGHVPDSFDTPRAAASWLQSYSGEFTSD